MKVIPRFLGIAIGAIVLSSCGSQPAKTAETTTEKKDSIAVAVKKEQTADPAIIETGINTDAHNKLNDVALYLAGIRQDSSSVPATLRNLSSYKQYCDTLDKGFSNIEKNRLSKMRDWAKTEMANELANPKTVLYPFSGPDILHCVQFFPDADQYVMLALERYGALPAADRMDSAKASNTLKYINNSLEDIIGKSYFITRKMAYNVSNQYNGFTPLACVFLERTGHSILDIKYKHLTEDGKEVDQPLDSMGHHQNDCVVIYFKKNGASKIQKLTYFKTNLGDDPYLGTPGMNGNPGLQAFLTALPEGYMYAKSASYLMCQKDFSVIRNICMKKSKTVLQDDTGIAFGFYDPKVWKITLYGNYEKPIADFHGGYYQANLQNAYKTDSAHVKPLPFSLGYHWKDQVQNLMKFEKKG